MPGPDPGDGFGADLFWIPSGSGAHVVRLPGPAFEAVAALLARRPRCDLYHSALEVLVPTAGTPGLAVAARGR